MWPVKPRCVECFSADVEWAPAGGHAVLYSFAVVHQRYPGFDEPYVVATVETAGRRPLQHEHRRRRSR